MSQRTASDDLPPWLQPDTAGDGSKRSTAAASAGKPSTNKSATTTTAPSKPLPLPPFLSPSPSGANHEDDTTGGGGGATHTGGRDEHAASGSGASHLIPTSPSSVYTRSGADGNSLHFSFEPPSLRKPSDTNHSSSNNNATGSGRRGASPAGRRQNPPHMQAGSHKNNASGSGDARRASGTAPSPSYSLGRLSNNFNPGDFSRLSAASGSHANNGGNHSGGDKKRHSGGGTDYRGAASAKELLEQLQRQSAGGPDGGQHNNNNNNNSSAVYRGTREIRSSKNPQGVYSPGTPPPPPGWDDRKPVERPTTGPPPPAHPPGAANGEEEEEEVPEGAVVLEPFLAPDMPRGRYVVFNLLATWGDANEVGLCGVEFFDEGGYRIAPAMPPTYERCVNNVTDGSGGNGAGAGAAPDADGEHSQKMSIDGEGQTTLSYIVPRLGDAAAAAGGAKDGAAAGSTTRAAARAASARRQLQLMAEYSASPEELEALEDPARMRAVRTDPRRQLANLLNDRNNTHDERAMFAMPYTAGHHHLLCFMFSHPVRLSMIRVFNYCGNGRVHTSKGARIAEITMDDEVIFRGEIGEHDGTLPPPSPQHPLGTTNCENILFTEDAAVLTRVMGLYKDINERGAHGTDGHDDDAQGQQQQRKAPTTFVFRGKDGGGGEADVDLMGTVQGGIGLSPAVQRQVEAAAAGGAQDRAASGGAGAERSRGVGAAGNASSLPLTKKMDLSAGGSGSGSSAGKGNKAARVAQFPSNCPRNVTSLCFLFLSTWGDSHSVGLSGLRFRDANGDVVRQTVARWHVQYPSGAHEGDPEVAAQLAALFDENSETACLLPFEPGVQVVLEFGAPIPQLGFLEVANYSVGERTFCGAKEVRVFLTSTADFAPGSGYRPAPLNTIYAHLWVVASAAESRRILRERGVYEVTPTDGVTLRKAPAALSAPRFQTYDLSMQAAVAPSSSSSGGGPSVPDILPGPGTGGERHSAMSGGMTFSTPSGGGGGGGAFFNSSVSASFAGSLNASMNIRAAAAMRRARMALWERPSWLLDYQPYLTPLLPIGYVCRVRLDICARNASTAGGANNSSGAGAGAAPSTPRPPTATAHEALKAYLKEWIVSPFRACSFVNENGAVIVPVRPGKPMERIREEARERERRVEKELQRSGGGGGNKGAAKNSSGAATAADDDEEEEDFSNYIPMVTESSVTTCEPPPTFSVRGSGGGGERPGTGASASASSASASASAASPPLAVTVDLLYVADIPFCLSLLTLHKPLVLPGSAAWVRRLQVSMDDTTVYDSGEAVIALDTDAMNNNNSNNNNNMSSSSSASSPSGVLSSVPALRALPPCRSSLRQFVVFTLDKAILEEIQAEVGPA